MKFSKKKKQKIRKRNQRRVKKVCKDMIGTYIDCRFMVVDQAKIDNTIYMLVDLNWANWGIYKIVKVGEFVQLSPKKVLDNKQLFEKKDNWEMGTKIKVSETGQIDCPNLIII